MGRYKKHLSQVPRSSDYWLQSREQLFIQFDIKLYPLTKFLFLCQLQVNTWSNILLRPVLLGLEAVFWVIQQNINSLKLGLPPLLNSEVEVSSE